jgi:hypothetical protein
VSWVHAVLDLPAGPSASSAAFWEGVLGWRLGPPWDGHPELRSFEPPVGAPYVHLQQVEEEPRVHLDLESTDTDETVGRAVALGASSVADHDRWRTLRSPGGLPFCVVAAAAHRAPDPVTWPDGHRSRMVQVCVDSPRPVHDREVAFWRGLLGGRWVGSDAPEFAGKWHDDAGSPLQLLFQRLDEEDGAVRAHLDHGTDDLPAEVRRLLDLGARDVGGLGRGWHTLLDPAGLPMCVTENSPERDVRRHLG